MEKREAPMRFRDRTLEPQRTIGKVVEFKDGKWQSTPIRVYVGTQKVVRT